MPDRTARIGDHIVRFRSPPPEPPHPIHAAAERRLREREGEPDLFEWRNDE